MTTYGLALLIGVIAGLRTMTAPAAVSWAAALGVIHLEGTRLAFLGWRFTPWILSALALGELVADQLPSTPSRKVAVQFASRLVSGGLSGGSVGVATGAVVPGVLAGLVGAVIGTYGGAAVRAWLASAFKNDRPAAFLEDAIAIGGALAAYGWLR